MANQLTVVTERIDDVVLLLHVMMKSKLPELLNENLPRHWKQKGLDWGWVVVRFIDIRNSVPNEPQVCKVFKTRSLFFKLSKCP